MDDGKKLLSDTQQQRSGGRISKTDYLSAPRAAFLNAYDVFSSGCLAWKG